jgi:hypothetical protein
VRRWTSRTTGSSGGRDGLEHRDRLQDDRLRLTGPAAAGAAAEGGVDRSSRPDGQNRMARTPTGAERMGKVNAQATELLIEEDQPFGEIEAQCAREPQCW